MYYAMNTVAFFIVLTLTDDYFLYSYLFLF